jgi:hypothetical protein
LELAIISYPDQAVAIFDTVGVRDIAAFIEQQTVVPCRSIVFGNPGGQMTAAFEVVVVDQ